MRSVLFGLVLVAALTVTAWQDRTYIWFDNWLPGATKAQTLTGAKLYITLDLLGRTQMPQGPARPPGALGYTPVEAPLKETIERLRQFELADGALAGEIAGPGLEIRLPQTRLLGGEISGAVGPETALLGVRWTTGE